MTESNTAAVFNRFVSYLLYNRIKLESAAVNIQVDV